MKGIKKSVSVAFCGLSAALITVIMLLGYIPYLTYSVPAAAGLVLMMVLIEFDIKHTVSTYLVSAVTVFLFCEMEVKLLYILLFGLYPWLKCLIERINSQGLAYALKIVFFNLAAGAVCLFLVMITNISISSLGLVEIYTAALFLVAANVVFLIYDFALSRMATYYIVRFHKTVSKILKK